MELMKVRQYSDQMRLLGKYKLDTEEQLKDFISGTETKIRSLTSERTGVYNKLRRCIDPEQIQELKSIRDGLSEQIAQCRKELKTANGVLENTDKIKENIKIEREIRTAQNSKSKNKSSIELHRSR